MRPLPRLAVGTVQPQVQREPATWGLLAALRSLGLEATLLHSASYLMPHDATRSLTGTGSRHLDSWAMSRSACLRTMNRAADQADLTIVDGTFDVALPPLASPEVPPGSSLDRLCDWLDLPRLAVIDVSLLDPCRLPRQPDRLDGLLLDCACNAAQAAYWQTTLARCRRAAARTMLRNPRRPRSFARPVPGLRIAFAPQPANQPADSIGGSLSTTRLAAGRCAVGI
jgi:hypothetical protein